MRDDRPALLVSSTSWTEDEDFSILVAALKQYDSQAALQNLPRVYLVITGKGPLKQKYMQEFRNAALRNVEVRSAWLQAENYPQLLASSVCGISLHTSSSGLDLPMKVIDMFGAGIPALALHFQW